MPTVSFVLHHCMILRLYDASTTLRPILYTREPVPWFILVRCVGLTLGLCSVRCYNVK